jgi:hypothetical protein
MSTRYLPETEAFTGPCAGSSLLIACAGPRPGPAGDFQDLPHGRAGRAHIQQVAGGSCWPCGGDDGEDLLAEAPGDA